MKVFHLFILFFSIALVSCETGTFYNKAYTFEDHKWSQDIKPRFEFEITDTSKYYDLLISVRVNTNYAYNNMWVFLKTKTPSGIEVREPFEIKISSEDGEWIGTKSGSTVQNELKFAKRKFPEKGKYVWHLEQGITENEIEEVLDVNVQLKQYDTNE